MVVNTVALQRGLNLAFNKAYDGFINNQGSFLNDVDMLVTRVNSTGSDEKYGWLGDVPGMKEWIGDKEYAGIEDYDYTIKNKDWYNGISIDRNELDDDRYGMVLPRIESMALAAANWPMELVAELIRDGDTNLAYDNAAFFSNRTINDNLLAGSGVTLANLKTDLTTGRTTMMRFVSDTGKLLRLVPDVIVCPPELEITFRELIESTAVQGTGYNEASKNVWSKWIKSIIPLPDLTDTNDWYIFATSMPLKPFIFQDRKKPVPVLDDTKVKANRTYGYSVEMRGNAGYGFYQMAVKFVNA